MAAICKVNVNHKCFNGGEGATWIAELLALSKRLDIMQSDGVEFDFPVGNAPTR